MIDLHFLANRHVKTSSTMLLAMCQEMKVDHGLTVPLNLMWPGHQYGHVKVIPVCINCEQYPMAQPWRTFELGRGDWSCCGVLRRRHNVGRLWYWRHVSSAGWRTCGALSIVHLTLIASTNWCRTLKPWRNILIWIWLSKAALKLLSWTCWFAMRGTLLGKVTERHRNYHAPISNTGSGLMLLENEISTAEWACRSR